MSDEGPTGAGVSWHDEASAQARTGAAQLLASAPAPARDKVAASVGLFDFLESAGRLSLSERKVLVAQALVMLEQNYAHLPLKMAMHAVNPLQRLRLLRSRLERQTPETMAPEWRFHSEMSQVFHSVRDLHTNYLLPAPFAGKVAYLPFQLEQFFDETGHGHFVVARLVEGFSAPAFGPGAEVTHWNGMPIARAVDVNALRFAGSNVAARQSRGLESLTIRPLIIHLPPDEEWVTVNYVGLDGAPNQLREPWRITENLPPMGDFNEVSTTAVSLGLDLGTDETVRAKKLLYAPEVIAREEAARTGTAPAAPGNDLATNMPSVFRARPVTTASGTFGHLRIFTFGVNDPVEFVTEFVRLLRLLPQEGLILDVRGNGGGHIYASEFTLQTMTPRRIVPEPVQFLCTSVNTALCAKHQDNPTGQIDLGPWYPSMEQATETGATFSAAFSITPEDGANSIGQQYWGPVVLITDARCYSATDIFAAGFQDHAVGHVLGVDDNTGAGGANVWTHALLQQLLEIPAPEPGSPYVALPRGANMRVSIRRTLRVGPLAGTPLEDLGVTPDSRHHITRQDILAGNVDLLEAAGQILATMPVRKLEAEATMQADNAIAIEVDVGNLDRIDVYVDGRPRTSVDVGEGPNSIKVSDGQTARTATLRGYSGSELVAARTVPVTPAT